jgi:hypothetical protein
LAAPAAAVVVPDLAQALAQPKAVPVALAQRKAVRVDPARPKVVPAVLALRRVAPVVRAQPKAVLVVQLLLLSRPSSSPAMARITT